MRTTFVLFFAGVVVTLVSCAQSPAKWSAEALTGTRVTEIKSGDATRTADKGELLEVSGRLTPPTAGPRTISPDEIRLAGQSKRGAVTSKWELAPVGVGIAMKGNCRYQFPDTLVKGGIGLGDASGVILWVRRETEGGPAKLEFVSRPVEFCAAFLVPEGASGPLRLSLGSARFNVAWR